MRIKLRYNIGDMAYVCDENEIVCGKVTRIIISPSNPQRPDMNNPCIGYKVGLIKHAFYGEQISDSAEKLAFSMVSHVKK